MDLPKQLAKEHIESEVREALQRESIELCAGSDISIPVLELTPEFRGQIFYAKTLGEVTIGYDSIEKRLLHELRGLQKVDNQGERVSRLLLVTNDGSPRFYRELEFLHKKQGGRVLICRLDVDAAIMGSLLGLEETPVKAMLLNRKTSVVNVLRSLLKKKAEDLQAATEEVSQEMGEAAVKANAELKATTEKVSPPDEEIKD